MSFTFERLGGHTCQCQLCICLDALSVIVNHGQVDVSHVNVNRCVLKRPYIFVGADDLITTTTLGSRARN